MTRIAWPRLMRLGMRDLGLAPDVFWGLTPAELFLLAGHEAGPAGLTRAAFDDLTARFPDTRRVQEQEPE